ncbi:hypothetical protein [Roseisolibacter sp. H3M3-2]|uniref:hypothetical protein n=1 Tax=Roseisolibacter sp. H3M3-2 TaxID=3031323 RepID=UPI0023DA5DAF|nr:hypothetical protein [Roseisolibacter sp. H3M3-2]MDF1503586.1 hypothetical protein [Roseisolibacter sp. H3M3-2]
MDLATTPAAGPFGPPAPAEPSRIRLTGPVGAVKLPPLCANCGADARGTLRVEKRFRRTSRNRPTRWLHPRLDVPFCDPCRAAHVAELPPIDPAAVAKLRWQFVVRVLPYVIPIGVILWMIPVVLAPATRSVLEPGGLAPRLPSGEWNWGLAMAAGIVGFFGFCLLGFLALVNRARHDLVAADASGGADAYVRRARVLGGDHAVFLQPPTSVLAAANFSDDRAELFEPEHHLYTFRDPHFADRVRALNADRAWSGKSARARWARSARNALFAVFLVVAGFAILNDWTNGALERAVREFLP